MVTGKLKAGIVGAIIAVSVLTPLVLQHQAQARLRGQDALFRRQADQLAQLMADNERLARLQAKNSGPRPDNQLPELLNLRSEVGRLKRTLSEMQQSKAGAPLSPEDKLALLAEKYGKQVARLKEWLAANPAEKIPELASLPDQDWVDAVDTLEKDDNFARAMESLRANAELGVMGKLSAALRSYYKDNNGQFPADLSQLKSYLKSPIDGVILQRYEIVPSSSLVSELQGVGDWVITQVAPTNPVLDPRFADGLTGGRMADSRVTNRWTLIR